MIKKKNFEIFLRPFESSEDENKTNAAKCRF